MSERKATREGYGDTLAQLGREHPDIVVFDADLSGATYTSRFAAVCPERFFDFGIAEANMVAAAGGMSTVGYVPFVSSFAMFATGRAYEQVRNTVGYPHLNVKVCASHAGISVGEDGASHQCCEDIALMRSIPGMTVICPSDYIEACAAVRAAYEYRGPVYMRLGRYAVPVINDRPDYSFELGKGIQMRDGSDVTVVATGLLVASALEAAETLAAEGISVRVINIHTLKPLDEEIILRAARETGKILTAEEHSVIGGLGEAVCSLLSEKLPTTVHRLGVQDVYGHSASAAVLLHEFGMDGEGVAAAVRRLVNG